MRKTIMLLMCVLMLLSGCGSKKEEETEVEVIPEEPIEIDNINPLDSYDALYLWGADPGLGIRTLHELGYTGKGVNVAYIDQPINSVPDYEIADSVVYNFNIADEDDSMHGQATSSLLCGKNLGTAPDANLYFFGYPAWKENQQQYWVTCMDELIECLEYELAQNHKTDSPFYSYRGDGWQHFYKSVNLIYSDERLEEFLGHPIERDKD